MELLTSLIGSCSKTFNCTNYCEMFFNTSFLKYGEMKVMSLKELLKRVWMMVIFIYFLVVILFNIIESGAKRLY